MNLPARVLAILGVLTIPAFSADTSISGLLRTIEDRYNRTQTLKLSFSETYRASHRPVQNESGVLYLRKPGRMLWDYTQPAGKVFLSDGKYVFQYLPGEHQAEKSRLKESDDMRAPLAFLLGKLDFNREFKSFEWRKEGPDTWIIATPKSPDLVYSKVEFLATPAGEIRRMRVTGQDLSTLDFSFSGEQVNPPIPASAFVFHPPAGVQLVETER